MSHNSRNKQLKLFEISITGLFSIDTAEETKASTHVFRQREMCSTHVGPERRTSTCFPPVMHSWLFGFSLTFWRPRRRPRSRCLKSLLPPLRRTCSTISIFVSLSSQTVAAYCSACTVPHLRFGLARKLSASFSCISCEKHPVCSCLQLWFSTSLPHTVR